MFPPTKRQPKRVGGAPFSSGANVKRGAPAQPQSARASPTKNAGSPIKSTGSAALQPASARTSGHIGAEARAENYYRQMLGGQHGESGSVDMRQDWRLIEEIDALDHFNKEEQLRQQQKQKETKYRDQLQEQLSARNNVVYQCRDVWKDWRAELEEDVQKYQQEEETKRTFKLDMQRRFNQERQAQLDQKMQRQAKQKEADRKVEQKMMLLAEEAKRREEEKEEAKKLKVKQDMMHMKTQADIAVERRNAERKAENQRDVELQEAYEAMLAEQDRRRNAYFASIREKQASLQAAYEQSAGNKIAEQAAADEARARKHQEAKEAKAKAEHAAREQWRKDLYESSQAAVRQQLSMQEEERRRKREEELRYIAHMNKEEQKAHAKELEKVQLKKDAVLANALYIRKQIEEKESGKPKRVAQAQMSEIERQFNKQKLDRACDPNRADGLQMLLEKKKGEYRHLSNHVVAMPS